MKIRQLANNISITIKRTIPLAFCLFFQFLESKTDDSPYSISLTKYAIFGIFLLGLFIEAPRYFVQFSIKTVNYLRLISDTVILSSYTLLFLHINWHFLAQNLATDWHILCLAMKEDILPYIFSIVGIS